MELLLTQRHVPFGKISVVAKQKELEVKLKKKRKRKPQIHNKEMTFNKISTSKRQLNTGPYWVSTRY